MNRCSENFLFACDVEKTTVGEGMVRQVLGYDPSLMMARVEFETGAIGYQHAHAHAQVTYVESGKFEFTVGSTSKVLKAGDCVYIPPDELHGAVCREAGVLLAVFSPSREDFLTE